MIMVMIMLMKMMMTNMYDNDDDFDDEKFTNTGEYLFFFVCCQRGK